MTAQLYLPYTYIIGWRKERKFYYGVRWANTCTPEDDLWNEYFTSSKSMVPLMRTLYGEPDLVKIHRTFSDKDEAILFEEQMLRRLDVLNNDMWLNQNIKGADFQSDLINKTSSKPTTIDGITYPSRTMAAKNLGVTIDTICNWIKKGRPDYEKINHEKSIKRRKQVTIDGITYSSITEAATQLNVHRDTITQRVKRNGNPHGLSKETVIDGIVYPSRTVARKQLGINKRRLYKLLAQS